MRSWTMSGKPSKFVKWDIFKTTTELESRRSDRRFFQIDCRMSRMLVVAGVPYLHQ